MPAAITRRPSDEDLATLLASVDLDHAASALGVGEDTLRRWAWDARARDSEWGRGYARCVAIIDAIRSPVDITRVSGHDIGRAAVKALLKVLADVDGVNATRAQAELIQTLTAVACLDLVSTPSGGGGRANLAAMLSKIRSATQSAAGVLGPIDVTAREVTPE